MPWRRSTSCGSPRARFPGARSSCRPSARPTASSPTRWPRPPASTRCWSRNATSISTSVAAALRELAPSGAAIAVMSEAVGDAVRIGEELAERAGVRVHPTILGHAQRASAPSSHDRAMGRTAGRAAVEALSSGRSTFISLGKDGTANALPLHTGTHRPTTRSAPMSLGYDRPLYILASDHRTSFQTKLFGIEGTPTDEEREKMAEAKRIILQGLLAVAESAEAGTVGTLMDEEYGASAARAAKESGLVLALAAEKSSQAEFELEYGDDVRRAHRGVRPGLRQGAGPLQPRGRSRDEPPSGGPAGGPVELARPAGDEVPVRAHRPAGAGAAGGAGVRAGELRDRAAPAAHGDRHRASSRRPASSPTSGRSRA